MMARNSELAFDPHLERVVAKSETSSDRIRAKLEDPYTWCFCELCWRPTEFSTVQTAPIVVKRLGRGNAKIVPLTDAIRAAAQKRTDAIVERYARACKGEFGPYEAGKMWSKYCILAEMRGDRSIDGFQDHVERRMLVTEWARHGKLVWSEKLPGQPEDAPKPSKLYCSRHNPRRSIDARREYQRDRRFSAEYELMLDCLTDDWIRTGHYQPWDVECHANLRRSAYQLVQYGKHLIIRIEDLLKDGELSQADLARKLGVSRQAVSAALKRRSQKQANC